MHSSVQAAVRHHRLQDDLSGLIRNLILDFVSNLLLGPFNQQESTEACGLTPSVPHRRTLDVQLGNMSID